MDKDFFLELIEKTLPQSWIINNPDKPIVPYSWYLE